MSSDLLMLEKLGLRLEELKKEIEIDNEENKLLEDKRKDICSQMNNINLELGELYSKKNLKENSTNLKNKNFFKLFRLAMVIVVGISLITDCVEGITINQTFPNYFNLAVFFGSFGAVLPFHIMYVLKINKKCKGINLEEITELIEIKTIQLEALKKELVEIKNISKVNYEKNKRNQEELSFVKNEMKSLEQQIKINNEKDKSPKQMIKRKEISFNQNYIN